MPVANKAISHAGTVDNNLLFWCEARLIARRCQQFLPDNSDFKDDKHINENS